ncbi:hypothetical protein GOBAR_DD02479 [Gossypium barbadense]|nr:hypothetical protein GOBAR_DD02479 [Gossypium barbadense]
MGLQVRDQRVFLRILEAPTTSTCGLRVRSQWLKEGDRSTHYFHMWASGCRKNNSIERLKDMHGNWHEDKEEICHIAWNYFNNLFKTSINAYDKSELQIVLKCINKDMNRRLNGKFTNEEILMAFKQMDPRKASRIDGLSGIFFKEHWPIVGEDVLRLYHDILQGNKSADMLKMKVVNNLDGYLGLPIPIGMEVWASGT